MGSRKDGGGARGGQEARENLIQSNYIDYGYVRNRQTVVDGGWWMVDVKPAAARTVPSVLRRQRIIVVGPPVVGGRHAEWRGRVDVEEHRVHVGVGKLAA